MGLYQKKIFLGHYLSAVVDDIGVPIFAAPNLKFERPGVSEWIQKFKEPLSDYYRVIYLLDSFDYYAHSPSRYKVALVSRIDKIIVLFCKRAL